MTDIVERLRDVSRGGWPDADEAASEIERLRGYQEKQVMTDIVARLRESSVTWSKDTLIGQAQARMEAEAANEIVQLRGMYAELIVEIERLRNKVTSLKS